MWIEIVGWYGAAAILGGYAATSLGWLDAKQPGGHRIYQTLNLTGAAGIVVVSAAHANWQPAVLNVAWAVIALFALARPPAESASEA
ncbi:MAG: hypothetical protein EP330_04575 [Deltaproteobacteria bacterium]|nr:MAG: hypothetical protein EP330_04575 [Deltaproteobacteria bacterium]